MTQSIPYEQALLIKRTAWRNMQSRAPRKEDEKYVPTAIRMLTYIACLNYAMCDMEEELSDAGLLRHSVKYNFRTAQTQVQQVHQQAYEMLGKASVQAAREYNDKLEEAWQVIDESVALQAPERAANIVFALCRLIKRLNGELSGHYDFAPARVLYRIPTLIECTRIRDHRIENIIERNMGNEKETL